MSYHKTFSAVVAAAALTLTLSACSSDPGTPTPSPTTQTTAPVEMFDEGVVSFAEFEERVVPPNQAIKTLRVKSTGEVTAGETSQNIVSEGVVDQSDPDNIKFSIESTGDVEYEVIQIDGVQYYTEDGENWSQAPVGADGGSAFPVTTSTSFFKELSAIDGSVTKVEYMGVDEGAHKFSLDVDVDLVMGTEDGVFGDNEMVVWLNDDYELVKLDSTIVVNGVTSAIVSEQSEFNEPIAIEAPELG